MAAPSCHHSTGMPPSDAAIIRKDPRTLVASFIADTFDVRLREWWNCAAAVGWRFPLTLARLVRRAAAMKWPASIFARLVLVEI